MMTIVSIIVLVAILFITLRGAFRGFSGELAHLAGLVACIGFFWVGFRPIQRSIDYLPQVEYDASCFYATLVVFVIGAILFFIIAKIVDRIGSLIIPQPLNAILGAIVGAAKALFFTSMIAGAVMLVHDKIKTVDRFDSDIPSLKALFKCWDKVILKGLNIETNVEGVSEKILPTEETDGGH